MIVAFKIIQRVEDRQPMLDQQIQELLITQDQR